MHGMGGTFGLGMGFGWIFWLLIIGGTIWAVTQFSSNTQTQRKTPGNSTSPETPREILKKRYARGEISKEE